MSKVKTSPLDPASARLSKAFARLEKAVESKSSLPSLNEQGWIERMDELEADIASLRDENETLRAENAKLSLQLQEMQQDYLELQDMANNAADLLDRKAEQLELMG